MRLMKISNILKPKKQPVTIYDIYDELKYRSDEINEFRTLIGNITDKRNIPIFHIEKYEDNKFIGISIGFDVNNMDGYTFSKCVKEYPRLNYSKCILNNLILNDLQDKITINIRHNVGYASSIVNYIKLEERRGIIHRYNTYERGQYSCHLYDVSCISGIIATFCFNKKYFNDRSVTWNDVRDYLMQYIKVWVQSQ